MYCMGSPSIFVLLLLVNELGCSSQWLGIIELGRKTTLSAGRKKAESRRSHVITHRRQMHQNLASKPQPFGDTQINRSRLI